MSQQRANSGSSASRLSKGNHFISGRGIDRLFAIIRQEGYVVLLCNSEGVAIHKHRGHQKPGMKKFKKRGIWLGGVSLGANRGYKWDRHVHR